MGQPNIVAVRVDERLVHGQGQLWIQHLGVNTVIVANDKASNDTIAQTLMKTVVSKNVKMRFFTIDKTIEVIHKAAPEQRIFIIVEDCQDLQKLVEGGVPIVEVNLGNIHNKDGSEKITRSIFLTEDDKVSLKACVDSGVLFNTVTTPRGDDGVATVDIRNYI